MANATRATPQISFAALVKAAFVPAVLAATEEVGDTAGTHHAVWTASFGDNSMVADGSGNRGAAPPLADATIERKMMAGLSEEDAHRMLFDPTKRDSVDEMLMHSTFTDPSTVGGAHSTVNEQKMIAKVHASSLIDNEVFPYNEFGMIHPFDNEWVPMRTTLLPTDMEISEGFVARATQRIGSAMKTAIAAELAGKK